MKEATNAPKSPKSPKSSKSPKSTSRNTVVTSKVSAVDSNATAIPDPKPAPKTSPSPPSDSDNKVVTETANYKQTVAVISAEADTGSDANTDNTTTSTGTNTATNYEPGLLCGLGTGMATTVLFNPYDRALFLSVRDHRRFLSLKNFTSPFQGMMQSIGIRAISGGMWFPLEHYFRQTMGGGQLGFLAGSAAGLCSSAVLNPLTAIKYQTWSVRTDRCLILMCFGSILSLTLSTSSSTRVVIQLKQCIGFPHVTLPFNLDSFGVCIYTPHRGHENSGAIWQEAMRMWRRGGIRPFMFGFRSRIYRDVVFGATYTGIRQKQGALDLPSGWAWMVNAGSAATATILSAPFNYVQNKQYATSSRDREPTTVEALTKLMRDVKAQKGLRKLSYMQQRLRIGTW